MSGSPRDLDFSVDQWSWVREHRVYCPVPWCQAHSLRSALCGDVEGDYDGIHVGRLAAAEREAARVGAEIDRLVRQYGHTREEAWIVYASFRLLQDSIDLGTVRGRRGRRRLVP